MTAAPGASAVLRVDLEALATNYRKLCRMAAPARVAGVVKADGYGLGAARVSATLVAAGCRHFFVALLSEAAALRPTLPDDADLFVLNGLQPGSEAECAALGVVPVLNSLDQIERWADYARRTGIKLRAALQVDTGMSRLGLAMEEVAALNAAPGLLDGLEPIMLMSHLACADEPDDAANAAQYVRFEHIAAILPKMPLALDNSGGIFLGRDHFDYVRAGIALYGGAPQSGADAMAPVVSLEARIVQVRTVVAGTGVGYGMSYRAERDVRIATISVGYADGLPRTLGDQGSAFIAGVRVPIVGRVSMDSITLDVSAVATRHLVPGAPVELIGPHQSLDALAHDAGTISYEILTRLGHRYVREYAPLEFGHTGMMNCQSAAA